LKHLKAFAQLLSLTVLAVLLLLLLSLVTTYQALTDFLIEQGFDPELYEIVGAPRTSRWQTYYGEWLTSYRFNFRLVADSSNLSLLWQTAKRAVGRVKKRR